MLSDYEIAKICVRLYDDNPPQDDFWTQVWPRNGGYAALKVVDGCAVVVWRGSTTALDWLLNFKALPVADGSLGMVDSGFVEGVWPLQDQITAAVGQLPVIVTGHSRGAAQAAIFAGHLIAVGKNVQKLMVMGCPRPGYQQLADILRKTQVHSYKNGRDPVTDVPLNIDLIGTACDLPYVQVAPYMMLKEKPHSLDIWGPVAWHHWQLYLAGIEKLAA